MENRHHDWNFHIFLEAMKNGIATGGAGAHL